MNKHYRVKDIARMAGVSTGTVDRILHKRGKVSVEAQEKVNKVLKEINYQPNLIARSLALKKKYRFITVTPYYKPGEYWSMMQTGFDKAGEELFSYNVEIIHLHFDQYDKSSFDRLIPEIEQMDCQGVVIATLMKESVLELTKKLDQLEIPYVLIDSFIEGTRCLSYYGTHSYDSGYIAGRLMSGEILRDDDIAIFRFLRKGDFSSTQVNNREEGFRDFLKKEHFNGRLHTLRIHAADDEENRKLVHDFLRNNPKVKAGIIFNSRAYLLGKYLKELPSDRRIKLIGYDILDANINCMEQGLVTHLIAQRPEVQGLNSIKALFRHLVLKEELKEINYMPIDILIKENIQYYNNYI